MSKPLKEKRILKEQKLNSILLETYKPVETQIDGSPVIATFEIDVTNDQKLNANGRLYPEEVWNQPDSLQFGGKYLDENGKLRPLSLLGNLDHPTENQLEVFLDSAGLAWGELERNPDGRWRGKAHVLNTPKGKIIKTFLDYAKTYGGGEQIGVSTRADGDTELVESAGTVYERVLAENFYLVAVDFVYNPSVFSANSPTLLESRRKQRTLLENIKKLAEEDTEHIEVYNSFIKELKTSIQESASLDKAKKNYLKELKEQEYKLHQAVYEIDNMTDEDFDKANFSETLTRAQFLKKIKDEHKKIVNEIDKEEGALEEMTNNTKQNNKEVKVKKTLKEKNEAIYEFIEEMHHFDYVIELYEDKNTGKFAWDAAYKGDQSSVSNFNIYADIHDIRLIGSKEGILSRDRARREAMIFAEDNYKKIIGEDKMEQLLEKESITEDVNIKKTLKENDEALEDIENTEEEEIEIEEVETDEEIEDDIKEVEDDIEDELDDNKVTLESIHTMLTQVMTDIEEMRNWFFDIEDAELGYDLEVDEEVDIEIDEEEIDEEEIDVDEDIEIDEDYIDITDEELDDMTLEELEALEQAIANGV